MGNYCDESDRLGRVFVLVLTVVFRSGCAAVGCVKPAPLCCENFHDGTGSVSTGSGFGARKTMREAREQCRMSGPSNRKNTEEVSGKVAAKNHSGDGSE